MSAGLPFLIVSTTAPLLQRWYAATGGPGSSDPYFLYALSNLGSLLALIGYPFLIEPNFTLAQQGRLWAMGFGVLAALLACAGLIAYRADQPAPAGPATAAPVQPPLAKGTRVMWVALAFVPSCLLLGVTTHITTDIAPIPLLWVIPLALYLLSFVIVFAKLPDRVRLVPRWLFLLLLAVYLADTYSLWWTVALHLALFFSAALVLHGELARRRPEVGRLTEYYFCMSLGGVLGGLVAAILAPLLLNGFYEYRAALVLACVLMPSPFLLANRQPRPLDRRAPLAIGAIAALLMIGAATSTPHKETVLQRSRNFFGVLTVYNEPHERPRYDVRRLHNGTTIHGVQLTNCDVRSHQQPRTYYFPSGPIGRVFREKGRLDREKPVAVIGLGSGAWRHMPRRGRSSRSLRSTPT